MNRLRVGVIGVGHLGQHHARIYASLLNVELRGVADINSDRAQLIGDRYATPSYTEFRDLLEHVDAVSVAVPTSSHHAVTKTCLAAGLHVLLEKPIASTLQESYDLIQLARHANRVLQVGHVERFNPVVPMVRSLIHEPGFIECHRLSPFQPRGIDVDVVLDLMIHDLDLILSFGPGSVKQIDATGVTVLSHNIDIANARIEFSSGCVANLTASRVSTGRLRKLRVFQRDAYISVDYHTREGMISRRRGSADGQPIIETEHFKGTDDEPLKLELESFVHAAKNGSRPQVSGEEALAALELAMQALDRIKNSEYRGQNQQVSQNRTK